MFVCPIRPRVTSLLQHVICLCCSTEPSRVLGMRGRCGDKTSRPGRVWSIPSLWQTKEGVASDLWLAPLRLLFDVCVPHTPLPASPIQELELLGEDAVPQVFYTPLEDEEGEFDTAEARTQTRQQGAENASDLEAKLVEMNGLGLEPEKKRDAEAVPAVGEADA